MSDNEEISKGVVSGTALRLHQPWWPCWTFECHPLSKLQQFLSVIEARDFRSGKPIHLV